MACTRMHVKIAGNTFSVELDGAEILREGKIECDALRWRTLEMFRRWLDEGRFGSLASPVACAREDLAVVGTYLYRVFSDDKNMRGIMIKYLKAALGKAAKEPALRLELEFGAGSYATRLAQLCWEFMYCPPEGEGEGEEEHGIGAGFFIAAHTKLILSRRVGTPLNGDLEQDEKLRILLLISRPKFSMVRMGDCSLQVQGFPQPDDRTRQRLEEHTEPLSEIVEKELEKIENEQRDRVELRVMGKNVGEVVSKEAVAKAIEDFKPQIVHFIGHGKFEGHVGSLALMRTDLSKAAKEYRDQGLAGANRLEAGTEAAWVDESAFADCFAGHRPRVVILQACESARSDSYSTFNGVALRLVQAAVPAVIAMRYRIDNGPAQNFARTFYASLAAGFEIDQAVQAGRMALAIASDPQSNFLTPDFGSPIAFFQRSCTIEPFSSSTAAILPSREKPTQPPPPSQKIPQWRWGHYIVPIDQNAKYSAKGHAIDVHEREDSAATAVPKTDAANVPAAAVSGGRHDWF